MKGNFLEFLSRNCFKIVCTLLGLLIAILILTINFWRTLLIVGVVAIGVLIGSSLDKGESVFARISTLFERLFKK